MGRWFGRHVELVTAQAVLASAVIATPLAARGDAKPYTTAIVLSSADPATATTLTFSFRATSDDYEEVDDIEIGLPSGMGVNRAAFVAACKVNGKGHDAASGCPTGSPTARLGSGTMTVDVLGMHTVKAGAYLIDATSGPGNGINLAFYFPSGQVFGVSDQSVFGTIPLDGTSPPSIKLHDIQSQLSLPFGASAELADGNFAFVGQSGNAPFTNPASGSTDQWTFSNVLSWEGGAQTDPVHATVAR